MKAAEAITLDDKYTALTGRVVLSGPQALVRLPMIQHLHDRAAGLNTGGFISGYQGSPLATYDVHLASARRFLAQHQIQFQPGVNEELAATACWGSQQLENFGTAKVDGVFAIWYGKGPGVDRASDAIKHGNHSGTHRHGGVLAIFGDDHAGKSSTLAHQSEPAFAVNAVPVVYPATLEEFFEFGLWGWGLSRYSGLWVGLKAVNETLEQTSTVDLDFERSRLVVPAGGVFPREGVHYRSAYTPALNDTLVTRFKLPLVPLYARSNPIDKQVGIPPSRRRLGVVSAGKSFQDVLHALKLLRITHEMAADLGVSLYKIGLIWPIEPDGLRAFARGQEELLIVEEKKSFLETQIAQLLYADPTRPRLIGKQDERGAEVFPIDTSFEAVHIAIALGRRLSVLNLSTPDIAKRVAELEWRRAQSSDRAPVELVRGAFYCSGCPHNTSTNLPQGSQGMGGIGCHGMATFTRTDTLGVTQMGGEGATWYGAAPFTNLQHVFQNLGDGTYYHSGLMAIRGAVAAKVNLTYKILFNDATAMTGGQPLAGPLSVGDITRQVLAENVACVAVATDRPELYGRESGLGEGVRVWHRDKLDELQREFRDIPGVTVIVYEQTCAAEKRRRRKRQTLPDPPQRLFINEAVCEGCGDCSTQSNCVSLFPKETQLGRKRVIDQSSCNKDFSCVKGFCPSFVTVRDPIVRKPNVGAIDQRHFSDLPTPAIAPLNGSFGMMVAGIGGTGVVTVGAVLAMAGHLEGKAACTYDVTGMAQKNAAVFSHVKLAIDKAELATARLGLGEADVLLGCDLVASVSSDAFQTLSVGKTTVVANRIVIPTSDLQKNPDRQFDAAPLEAQLVAAVGEGRTWFVEAHQVARELLGDTIATNFFLVGGAVQLGLMPVALESIERAIEMNGAAVELNKRALQLGRLWVHCPDVLQATLVAAPIETSLHAVRRHRESFLTQYQNAAYADRYRRLLNRVEAAEELHVPESTELTLAVAHNFSKLLAYKDEYEVARLHSSREFQAQLQRQFSGFTRLSVHLAPPLLARRDPVTGVPRKIEFGPWIFRAFKVLAALKGLRGTAFDVFGYTSERRSERQWIVRYEALIDEICDRLRKSNHAAAVEIARLPEKIRGFGHIKHHHTEAVERVLPALLLRFRANP